MIDPKTLCRLDSEANFGPGRHQGKQGLRIFTNDVSASRRILLRCFGHLVRENWHVLSRQDQGRRRHVGISQQIRRQALRFVRIARPNNVQVRHRPKTHEMLNRLVRRTIFSDTHRIMSEYKQDRSVRERRETYGRSHVIGKDEKCGADGPNTTVQSQAHHHGAHAELSNAVVDLLSV